MTGYDAEKILNDLEPAVAAIDVQHITPLPVDRWIASSCMQKSIRRGNVKTAQRAALAYWMQDKRSFWNRLGIVCMEDCGVASPDLIVQTLTISNAPAWRAKHNDWKVAAYLVRRMCETVKIRLCDEMYSIAGSAPEYQAYRQVMGKASNETLADNVLHDGTSLPEKAISLWLLAGSKRYPADNMPERNASLYAAVDALRSLHAPHDLTEACIASLRRSQYPLALFTPLLWTELQRHSLTEVQDQFQPSPVEQDIPLIALDGFTRIGKHSFAQLQKTIPGLKPFTTRQTALSAFFSEGYCVNQRLTSTSLEAYRTAGEIIDIEAAGLCVPSYMELRECLTSNLHVLEDIRRKRLRAYLKEAA